MHSTANSRKNTPIMIKNKNFQLLIKNLQYIENEHFARENHQKGVMRVNYNARVKFLRKLKKNS